MAKGHRQNSAASPASQIRRSSRNSRNSVPGNPSNRRSTGSRSSSTYNLANQTDDFDWDSFAAHGFEYNNLNEDYGFLGEGYDRDELLGSETLQNFMNEPGDSIPISSFNNSHVAVPSTPHAMHFGETHQQSGPALNYQTPRAPATMQYIGDEPYYTYRLEDGTINMVPASGGGLESARAAGPNASHSTTMGNRKRTSTPRSPRLPAHINNYQEQYMYGEPFGEQSNLTNFSQIENPYLDRHEPTGYPSSHGNYATQPYFSTRNQNISTGPSTPRNHLQGPVPPGGRSNKRSLTYEVEYTHEQRNPNNRAADTRNSSPSTYPSRHSSSGRSRESPEHRSGRTRRQRSRAPFEKRVSVFAGDVRGQYQKPEIADFNPEVRINKTTKGLTTRTGKINLYNPGRHYTYTMHPLGTPQQPEGADWQGKYYTHKYNDASTTDKNSGEKTIVIYEFDDRAMPADMIRDFILSYPSKRNKLTLRIQVGPADAGRRYKKGADKCRFAECPARNGGQNRTIKHGFYRVAFDERDDDDYDPFAACCGFAHLYCMERFLDFEYICRKANVVVDTRVQLRREPKGKFAAAFDGKQTEAAELADNFINAARHKPDGTRRERGDRLGVRQLEMFAEYPLHGYRTDETWDATFPYEHTLGYHMNRITEGHRAYAQLTQFAKDGLCATKITVHRGDLGIYAGHFVFKVNEPAEGKGKKKSARGGLPFRYSDPHFAAEVQRRIERAESVLEERGNARPRKNQQKATPKAPQRLEAIEEDEEDEGYAEGQEPWQAQDDDSETEFDERPPRKGGRSSKRITSKRRVDYRDEPDDRQDYGRGRKRSEPVVLRQMQQNPNQDFIDYDRLDQFDWQKEAYIENQEAQQLAPQRPSSIPRTHSQRASSLHLNDAAFLLDQGYYDQEGYDPNADIYGELGLNILNGSPSVASSKRRRSSRSEQQFDDLFESSPKTARASKRLRSEGSNQSQGLHRRPSSTVSSIMRRPSSRTSPVTKRHASFNKEPVSHQKRFDSNAPPQHVRARMVKELETDLAKSPASKNIYSPVRTLRSGRSLSSAFE